MTITQPHTPLEHWALDPEVVQWNAAPLVAEDWSKYEFSERVVNGERRAFVTFRTRVIAKNAGSLF